MTLWDLTHNQIIELSQALLCEIYDKTFGTTPSYGELATAENIITFGMLEAAYGDTVFTEDDFCTAEW